MGKSILVLLVVLLLMLGLFASATAAPRPITRPIVPTSTPIQQICRPNGFCYRPPPTVVLTPVVCKPNPACNPAVESCGMVCH